MKLFIFRFHNSKYLISLFGETTVTPEVAANNALIKKLKDFQSKINGLTINDLALVEENNTVIDTSNTVLALFT